MKMEKQEMTKFITWFGWILVMTACIMAQETKTDEKEAMEIGGVVTVDYMVNPSDGHTARLSLQNVKLSATVNIADNVTAAITLKANEGLDGFGLDNGVVDWQPKKMPLEILFGLQTYNHGLLTSRLINDPLILDPVQTCVPGLTMVTAKGSMRYGVGVSYATISEDGRDSLYYDTADAVIKSARIIETEASQYFLGIVNADRDLGDNGLARLSVRFSDKNADCALGAGYTFGSLTVDLEGFATVYVKEGEKPLGGYAGLAYAFGEHLAVAARYDALSVDMSKDVTHRVGAGITVNFVYGIFCAAEYDRTINIAGPADNTVALQIGLASNLKLPGYQRKTLTNKEVDG